MTNPDKRTSYLRKLVSAARSLVTYQVGLPVGCIRINAILSGLKVYGITDIEYPVFGEYLQVTQDLPISTDRLFWDRDVLRKKDKILEGINQKFRDPIFETCYTIIQRHATPHEAPPQSI
jgi:hypothetical protein